VESVVRMNLYHEKQLNLGEHLGLTPVFMGPFC